MTTKTVATANAQKPRTETFNPAMFGLPPETFEFTTTRSADIAEFFRYIEKTDKGSWTEQPHLFGDGIDVLFRTDVHLQDCINAAHRLGFVEIATSLRRPSKPKRAKLPSPHKK